MDASLGAEAKVMGVRAPPLLLSRRVWKWQVVLLSAAVTNGKLSVLEVRSTEAQWKLGSKAIRSLRRSFKA